MRAPYRLSALRWLLAVTIVVLLSVEPLVAAIAVDGSTPIRFATTGSQSSFTSASFTAPANALLVACINSDGVSPDPTITATDTGSLTWTNRVIRQFSESTSGGYSAIATARTTSSTSRTVTVTNATGARQMSGKVYVLTGVDVDGTPLDSVTASNEGGTGTNNATTTSITPGANGLLIVCDTDFNELGAFETSSDLTGETADYAGTISVFSGYKAATSGVGITGNMNAAGSATAQHKWTQLIVRESAGGGGGGVTASCDSLLLIGVCQ